MRIAFFFAFASLLLASELTGQSVENVLIHEWDGAGYQPCEPAIAICPNNPSKIVAGSVLSNVYTSADTGKTWTRDILASPLGVFGDPCIVAGRKSVYYFHLSDPNGKGWSSDRLLDRIVVQRSCDHGKKWNKGVGIGENHPADQDKEWACLSADESRLYATWTQFDVYGSKDEKDSTIILFSQSNVKAKKWSAPVRINQKAGDCLDGDNTVEGAVPSAGPNGEVYVAWAMGKDIWFDRSLDGGKTWLDSDIRAAKIHAGWDQSIPGIGRANGMPVTCTDLSDGMHRGRIYINWTDQVEGEDDTDVFVAYSDDKGDTWSQPIRVNNDPAGAHQFFTWMSVDPKTGGVHIVFYDRRGLSGNATNVVVASSFDGGSSFENRIVSDTPFVPSGNVFFGDYNNISAVGGVVRPIWTRNDKGRLSIWTALLNF
ncbi:MAG: glycosyl hydrolase [Cryomorphaceae bacterium]|nr:glycosyl hydrolase [Cryomorphaceae bacterium]